MRIQIPLLLSMLWVSPADAQQYAGVVEPQQSSMSLTLDAAMSSSGHLIGDYDATSNPSGTQTRPGVFGGSGNNPIPVDVSIDSTTAHQDAPAGLLDLDVAFPALQLTLSGLALDLLPSGSAPMQAQASATFETFHTINPGFIYPGGTPVALPLGEAAEIRQLALIQTMPAAGGLLATPDPDVFTFALQLAVELSFVVRISLPGSDPVDVPMDSLPLLLAFTGSLDRSQPGGLTVDLLLPPESFSGSAPVAGMQLPPVPIELPTLTADTASVILHLQAESLLFDGTLGLVLRAIASSDLLPDVMFGNGFE